MAFTNSQEIVAEYYIASLGRAPDAGGLDYWSGKLDSYEMTKDEIRDMFLDRSIPEVAIRFPEGQSAPTTIENIYQNVFGRQSDPDGLYYWVGRLNGTIAGQSQLTENELISTMIDIAKGNDGDREYLAQQLEDAETSYIEELYGSYDDYGFTNYTAETIYANSSINGEIETAYDRDWFKVYLTSGTTYEINVEGDYGFDTTLSLQNYANSIVGTNDDHYDNGIYTTDSQLIYTPTYSNYFYIDVGGFSENIGSYEVEISALYDYNPGVQTGSEELHIQLLNLDDDISPNDPFSDNLENDFLDSFSFYYNNDEINVNVTGDNYLELINDIIDTLLGTGLIQDISVSLGDEFDVYHSGLIHKGREIVLKTNYAADSLESGFFELSDDIYGNYNYFMSMYEEDSVFIA